MAYAHIFGMGSALRDVSSFKEAFKGAEFLRRLMLIQEMFGYRAWTRVAALGAHPRTARAGFCSARAE
jgi:hypothetical protein